MKDKMTHSELSDDVKASLNSLIEDKAQVLDPYSWILPPDITLPDGPPTHRRMPRKVHRWSVPELRKWKRALDNGEVKLLTEQDLKEETKRGKTVRREKKERVRAASVKLESKKKNMSVEVMIDSKFPRSKYQVIDESVLDVEVVEVRKTPTRSKSAALPVVFDRNARAASIKTQLDLKRNNLFPGAPQANVPNPYNAPDVEVVEVKKTATRSRSNTVALVLNHNSRAASMKTQLDPKRKNIFHSTTQANSPTLFNVDGPKQAYNLEYNFDDFFNSQPGMPLPAQALPRHNNLAASDIRVEREALKSEFRQKIAQIFGITEPEITEEDWETQISDLAKQVQRHEVDLRGELDVLRTVCKQTHEGYYKARGGVPVPFTNGKASESIEYVKGVFGDILYYGSGLAVEDALKAVKVRYQERLARNEVENKNDNCDCARIYEEEVTKVREGFHNSLTKLEGDIQRYAALCSRKTKKRGLEKDESSPVKNKEGDPGKRASKKAEIKSLRGQVAELQQQLDQNIQLALALSQQEETVEDQMVLIGRHEAQMKAQAREIETLHTQLKKKESNLSIAKNVQRTAKLPNLFSSTITATSGPPQVFKSKTTASSKQEAPTHPPKLAQVQGNPFLVSSPTSNHPLSPPAAGNPTSKRKRNKHKSSRTPDPDSNVLPLGVFDVLKHKGKKRDRDSRTRKAAKAKARKNRTDRDTFEEDE